MFYEYLSGDKVSDLVKYAMDYSQLADKKNIFVNILQNNQVITKKVEENDVLNYEFINDLYISSKFYSNNEKIFVDGTSVNNGFYDHVVGKSVESFINENLVFSNEIYPFYFMLEQNS